MVLGGERTGQEDFLAKDDEGYVGDFLTILELGFSRRSFCIEFFAFLHSLLPPPPPPPLRGRTVSLLPRLPLKCCVLAFSFGSGKEQ